MEDKNIFINLPDQATQKLADPAMSLFWSDFENRTLWVTDEINDTLHSIIDYIIYYNRLDRGKPKEERTPVRIIINSPGGNLDIAETLINLIKISNTPIYTYNICMAASAASLIFLSGHKRFALRNATFLLHQGSASMAGDYDTMMRAVEDYQKTVEKMIKFYIERTNIPEGTIREKIKQDWYLYANDPDIISNGICDVVLDDIDELL